MPTLEQLELAICTIVDIGIINNDDKIISFIMGKINCYTIADIRMINNDNRILFKLNICSLANGIRNRYKYLNMVNII